MRWKKYKRKEVVRMGFSTASILVTPIFFLYLAFIALGFYCLILFVRLAHRGIKALDLYIQEKQRQDRY
jgi:hypothetical protein